MKLIDYKNPIIFLFLYLLLIFNIWLINKGAGFTWPREMLFRGYADLYLPLIAFPIIFFLLHYILKIAFRTLKNINHKKLVLIVVILSIILSFSLFHTTQTNPDYGRYQEEAKYLVENGVLNFFINWGKSLCPIDFPLIPMLFGFSYKLLGENQYSILLVNILIFLGILISQYFLFKKLFNKKIALISLFLFSSSPFVISQSHLFLVDLGQTLFTVMSYYFIILAWSKTSKYNLTILFSISLLFLMTLTKGHAILFTIPPFLYSLSKTNYRNWKKFLFMWTPFLLLELILIYLKKDWFNQWLFTALPIERFVLILVPTFIVIFALIFQFLRNKNNFIAFWEEKKLNKLVLIFIFFLIITNIRNSFYFKTVFVSFNVVIATFFYLGILKLNKLSVSKQIFILSWILIPLIIPNTMFKYQLPTYPIISGLVSFFILEKINFKKAILKFVVITLSFSITITFFFFYPMIEKHVLNNPRNATKYCNHLQVQNIYLYFEPSTQEYGNMLQKSLRSKKLKDHNELLDLCPMPPSLQNIIDFYTSANIKYVNRKKLINVINNNNNNKTCIFLISQVEYPYKWDKILLNELESNGFVKKKTFDEAKGAGIWRVKINVWGKNSTQ
jgi:4-amino-4-deoxy-L-arabinose transferase-like glycosyltransferase